MTVTRGRVCTCLVTVALIGILASATAFALLGSLSRVYEYDIRTVTTGNESVELDASSPFVAGRAHSSGMRDGPAVPSVEARGASTTFLTRNLATEAAGLADDAAGSYGPFHRLESPTQTPATAALQEANGEVWGATARGGLNPAVKAYQGPLPPGARGVEFTTPVRPSDVGLGRPGDIAIWRRGSPGVIDVDDDFVKIAGTVVRNTQC